MNKNKNFHQQKVIDNDLKAIEKFKLVEVAAVSHAENLTEKIKDLEEKYDSIKDQQAEDLSSRKIYKHILNRMKINQIKYIERSHGLNKMLKIEDQLLNEEDFRNRKSKETKNKTKLAFGVLSDYVVSETRYKEERLSILSKDAKQQIKNTQNRDLRIKRQSEIAEAAADEERNNRAIRMRQGLFLHRLFYMLLDIKFKKSMKRFSIIGHAFHKIKSIYGVIEPKEVIEKIFTKEETYKELLSGINYNKSRIVKQREKNKEIEAKIEQMQNLKIQNIDPNKHWKEESVKIMKELSGDKEKLVKIQIVHEKITAWVTKTLEKLGGKTRSSNLGDMMREIKNCIERTINRYSINDLHKNIFKVEVMKVEEVLKCMGLEGRRNINITSSEKEENVMRELFIT